MRVVGVHYRRWSTLSYDPALFVAKARVLGYDQLEIDAPRLLAMSELGRTRLGFEARTHRIDLSYTWTPTAQYNLASLDEEVRKSALAYASELIKIVASMGGGLFNAPFYTTHPRSSGDQRHLSARRNQAVKSLKRLGAVASEALVSLQVKLLPPDMAPLLPSVGEALEFLHAVNDPRIGLDLDTYLLYRAGLSIPEAIGEAGFALKCLHVREEDGSRVGSGSLDWEAIRKSLDHIHYSGPIIHNPILKREVVERPYESNLIRRFLVE